MTTMKHNDTINFELIRPHNGSCETILRQQVRGTTTEWKQHCHDV